MYKTLLSSLILLLILSNQAFAQANNSADQKQNKKQEYRWEGPRFGVDISRFFLGALQPVNGMGWEVKADVPYQRKYFPTIELGYASIDDDGEGFDYENKGGYARLGIDMNIQPFISLSDHDILFAGARYAFSRYDHEANNIIPSVPQQDNGTPIWADPTPGSIASTSNTAHWFEFVFGMKGEVFNNLFLGWSARVKFMAYSSDKGMEAYYVPGFGYREVDIPIDFTYGVYYRLPIWKVKGTTVAKKEKVKKQDKR